MGQAVRKLRPPTRVATSSSSEPAVPIKRPSLEIKPAAPEPQMIVEPKQNVDEWDRPDPNFAAMSQKVVGIITTRPGGKQEMSKGTGSDDLRRPKPLDRHTTLVSGPSEDNIRSPGTLNVAHIRELFLLYQGQAEDQVSIDVEILAKKYDVDVELLRRVFSHTRLVQSQPKKVRKTEGADVVEIK